MRGNINALILESENPDYDLILGLDTIKDFKLTHDEDLNIIKRKENKEDEIIEKEIKEDLLKEYKVNFNERINTNQFMVKPYRCKQLHQRNKVLALLNEYNAIFVKNKYDVGTVNNYEAFINLQVEVIFICNKRPYKCSIEDRIEIVKQIAELLKCIDGGGMWPFCNASDVSI